MPLPHPSTSLRELSNQELVLYQHVSSLTGTIEDRQEQLENSTIGAGYRQVHRAYVQLATTSPDVATQLEALKRLVFLSWYIMTEPDIYSGLNYYDPELIRNSYTLLEAHLAATAPLDPELRWMLDCYAAFWDGDLLPRITGLRLPITSAFIAAKDPASYLVPERQLPPSTMANRGQMGLYWQSRKVERKIGPAPGE